LAQGEAKTLKYSPVIGLEIHVELNTKTKMFCRCLADYFAKKPNTHTCPVCLGLPGALPYINQEAINKCLLIGLALECQVSSESRFERKNYFYPDLPKGYQISQYRWPLCKNGKLKLSDGTIVNINRVHQEEDTGKLMHQGEDTVVDFNRSGVPLVEIVTEPDFTTSEAVREYAKSLQQLFRYLKVSNADMERGDMRLEANISLRPEGQTELPAYRVELKNINSFSFMVKAIEYEIKRQSEELEKGTKLTQQTRGWDDNKKVTYPQREKEEAHDYRYFPEPDLPEIMISMNQIDQIKSEMPELPLQAQKRLVEKLGITVSDAQILTENAEKLTYFEEAVELAIAEQVSPKQVANEILNRGVDIQKTSIIELVNSLVQRRSAVISDDETIRSWAKEAITENPQAVSDYKNGKTNAIMSLVGSVMRKSQGRADANIVKQLLEKLLYV